MKTFHNSGWIAFALLCLVTLCTAAGVNIVANNGTFGGFVNSVSGYEVNGAAGSSGQGLCSNGTYYNTPCNVPGTVGTPGTYPNPTSVTTNTFGQVTAITAGTAIDYYFTYTGCTLPNSAPSYCNSTVQFTTGGATTPTFATAMPDTNYQLMCTPDNGPSVEACGGAGFCSMSFNFNGLTTTGFGYNIGGSVATLSESLTPTVYCHAHHN